MLVLADGYIDCGLAGTSRYSNGLLEPLRASRLSILRKGRFQVSFIQVRRRTFKLESCGPTNEPPLPIPVVSGDSGQWSVDSAQWSVLNLTPHDRAVD